MRRRFYLGSLLAVPAVVVMLATIPGCPSKEGKSLPPPQGSKGGPEVKEAAAPKAGGGEAFVAKSTDATIKGRVVYDGTPPVMGEIKQIASSGDKEACHAGPEFTHKEQTWIVGKDHGVANVVVVLEPPSAKFFALDKAEADKYKGKEKAVIDQPFCVFEPHVVATFAAHKDADGKTHDTGATLLIKNSGKISHNTKSPGNGKVNGFNIAANPGKDDEIKIKFQKTPMQIACDKHNWMSAVMMTYDHPFFAVTDKDGNFEIKNAPSGVELTLKTWHEAATEATEKITPKAGDNDVKDLKVKAKAAS
jgi:hypothetical protein